MNETILTVKDKIRTYLEKETLFESRNISDETLIFKDGLLDSMGFIKLLTFIEENFGLEAEDADLIEENFESLNAISNYILKKRNK